MLLLALRSPDLPFPHALASINWQRELIAAGYQLSVSFRKKPMSQTPPVQSAPGEEPSSRDFSYTASDNLVEILDEIGGSLLISTYQAGRLVGVGASKGSLTVSLHSFDQIMGIAVEADRIAVGSLSQIWLLKGQSDIAARVEPAGQYDHCFITRSSHVTGEIRVHEMAWCAGELWFVNTLFSCLCTPHPALSFVPRWKPRFISSLIPGDCCHLNGVAVAGGVVRYVTALAETDTAEGWRQHRLSGGCLIDVVSSETCARGFAMPHSPRIHEGRVWLLDSGSGWLVTVDADSGRAEKVAELPGYPRGLAFAGRYAVVGLSRIRVKSGFSDLPIASRGTDLKCGVAFVELSSGRLVSLLEFPSGIHETFDVQILPGVRCAAIAGPYPSRDGTQPMWTMVPSWRTH
jgi:uncharacterized protein (TIGR03032 family)